MMNTKTNCLKWIIFHLICFLLLYSATASADSTTIPLLVSKSTNGEVSYSLSIKILIVMAFLTVLPALLITTTAFTRIIIVFSILRQAVGVPNVPSNQIILGLSLIMTIYVMMPVFEKMNAQSLQPFMQNKISEQKALEIASDVLKTFMLKQTRQADLNMFVNLAKQKIHNADYPLYVLMPAFITSELKTAFQIGFLIFLPFLVIDLVTASVLMSMGMMMLSPMIISLPFKILFFVMVNGWSLIITSVVSSFR
ncbi:flagellar type III secretion system pore protein FliP [Legionella nagasakiensis]|uniref:flagellar type III secretion system pore protein FliP n=1 Tax=Legionella nagasakiensis TaxID=535290 RepID=UPI001A952A56|nr:flagellar type III secretion system pore protein FliP [Legionella nagasakiensis]